MAIKRDKICICFLPLFAIVIKKVGVSWRQRRRALGGGDGKHVTVVFTATYSEVGAFLENGAVADDDNAREATFKLPV